MPDTAVTVTVISLATTILIMLLGLLVGMIRWQAKQDVYSRNHQTGIDTINTHLAKINNTLLKHAEDIARLDALAKIHENS